VICQVLGSQQHLLALALRPMLRLLLDAAASGDKRVLPASAFSQHLQLMSLYNSGPLPLLLLLLLL
jgi:hypothetical protein